MIVLKHVVSFGPLIASIFLFGLLGMTAEMGIAVAGSSLVLAFANLDKFENFKGAGFEAKMKIKEVVDEANATIEHLKSVAAPLLITSIELLAKQGHWPAAPFDKGHELYEKLVSLQNQIGVSDADLEIAKRQYVNGHAWSMINELARDIENSGEEGFTSTVARELGRYNYDVAPDLNIFEGLLSSIRLRVQEPNKLQTIKKFLKRQQGQEA